ncbi:MAG: hypothetical protein JXQ71_00215 [Verrucomicrobia bacterium]|nr:hypothetical protein [Verrucomicrobiota bacterium]
MNARYWSPARIGLLVIGLATIAPWVARAQVTYQKPPREVLEVLDAPLPPTMVLNPSRDGWLLVARERYPSIAELARPMLGLAGLRINPQNRGPHPLPPYTGITLQNAPPSEAVRVGLPPGARLGMPRWAPDGTRASLPSDPRQRRTRAPREPAV